MTIETMIERILRVYGGEAPEWRLHQFLEISDDDDSDGRCEDVIFEMIREGRLHRDYAWHVVRLGPRPEAHECEEVTCAEYVEQYCAPDYHQHEWPA
jgi:hypothetical protein